jgi:hypothetical protein
MRKAMIGIVLLGCAGMWVAGAHACSIFTVVRDGKVFMGNNEDYVKPGVIWFQRGRSGRYGRVNVGFDDKFAQGSMNEKGLAFDSAALAKVPWQADPNKESPKNLIEKIMDECATVEEALAYFDTYNCAHLAEAQFMFADATGASAVVAWLPDAGLSVVRREGDIQIITNTRLEMSGYRCPRFVKATQVLAGRADGSLETMTAVLEAIHQRGPAAYTSYSTVYDLQARKVYVYNLADFTQVREFDLMAELDRERRTVHKMASLFPDGPTAEDLTRGEQRADWNTRVELDDTTLAQYEGLYRPKPDITVEVRRNGEGGLTVANPGQPGATLIPEGKTLFRIAPDGGTVTFQVKDGTVEGLTLHKNVDVYAKRVE